MKSGTDNPLTTPGSRKRRREPTPGPAVPETEWARIVSTVARELEAIVPEKVDGKPSLRKLYCELAAVTVAPRLKERWLKFLESGDADAWRCMTNLVNGQPAAVPDGPGRCPAHANGCIIVKIRREGEVTHTLFSKPTSA